MQNPKMLKFIKQYSADTAIFMAYKQINDRLYQQINDFNRKNQHIDLLLIHRVS